MQLQIDGTDESGHYSKSANRAPYAVFSEERQDWIAAGLPWRWLARLIRWWHN